MSGGETTAGRGLDLSTTAWIGLVLVAVFVLLALAGPYLAPYSVAEYDTEKMFLGPSAEHWLGTDQNGVDTLSQLLHGAWVAFKICGAVVIICTVIGTALGIMAGYYGGLFDEIVMRVVDILLAFPGILLNIAIVALVARPGEGTLILALCINGWVSFARLARGQVLSLREREYVAAARCVGASSLRIMWRYILPNMLSPILVMMSLRFGVVILVEASLSYLGLGPQLDFTWGALLEQGTAFLWLTPRLAIIPGVAIMLVVLGTNLLGDGLRERFDPRA